MSSTPATVVDRPGPLGPVIPVPRPPVAMAEVRASAAAGQLLGRQRRPAASLTEPQPSPSGSRWRTAAVYGASLLWFLTTGFALILFGERVGAVTAAVVLIGLIGFYSYVASARRRDPQRRPTG